MHLRTAGIFALVLGATTFLGVTAQAQHDHASHAAEATPPASKATARCPIDGMKMRASGMTPWEHDGDTLYFCSQAQADMFAADPHRYYKTSRLGDMTLHMSVLTTDEYVAMMESMNMCRMVDAAKLVGRTHHVSVWVTHGDAEPNLKGAGLALRAVASGGEASTTALRYNKMMKTYDAAIAAPGDGEQKLAVVITTPPVSL